MGFLTGKTAIITGAGRAVLSDGRCGSIGYGIATAYAKEGANLVITGRNEAKLAAAKEELERLYNIKVLTIQADVNASAECFQCLCAFIYDFFDIYFYQNGIRTDTAHTGKRNDIFDFPPEKAEQFSGTGNNQRLNAACTFIEFNVCHTA